MSELEGLQRKLASIGGEGMLRLRWCVAQSNTFPTSTELAVLKQLYHSHGVSPQSHTHITLQFTGLTDPPLVSS